MRGTDLVNGSVRQDQFLGHNMIRRRAVNRNPRPGGIIRDHAADGGARAGGDVRAETKPVRVEEPVQLIEHDPRSSANGACLEIQISDLAVVAREFDNQSVADGAARKSATGAARSDGNVCVGRGHDYGAGLPGATRKRHGGRFQLIKRCVSGVELARQVVKRYFAISGGKRGSLRGSHRDKERLRRTPRRAKLERSSVAAAALWAE